MSLLSFEKATLSPMEAIDRMTEHRAPIVAELSRMALRYNINIVGGSHPTRTEDGSIQNVAYVCLRDGSVHSQERSTRRRTKPIGGRSRAAARSR
jgi:predicted amidohydrolase